MSYNEWLYAFANSVNDVDPSGKVGAGEEWYIRHFYPVYKNAADRLNNRSLTNLSNDAFAAMIAAKFLVKDATFLGDDQPMGLKRWIGDKLASPWNDQIRDWIEQSDRLAFLYGHQISWGPYNIPLKLAEGNLKWWEENCAPLGLEFGALHTDYYSERSLAQSDYLSSDPLGPGHSERQTLVGELESDEAAVDHVALAMLQASWRARQYYAKKGDPSRVISAYIIAMGVDKWNVGDEELMYNLSTWKFKGSQYNWALAIKDAAEVIGLKISVPKDYIDFTPEEKEKLRLLDP